MESDNDVANYILNNQQIFTHELAPAIFKKKNNKHFTKK